MQNYSQPIKKRKKYTKLTLPQKFEIYNKAISDNYYIYEICQEYKISTTTYRKVLLDIGKLINKELKTY